MTGDTPIGAGDGGGVSVATIGTPLGRMVAAASMAGLVRLQFCDGAGRAGDGVSLTIPGGSILPDGLAGGEGAGVAIPGGSVVRTDGGAVGLGHLARLADELGRYFAGTLTAFTVAVDDAAGTPFQRAAWAGLRAIPFGRTWTYGRQAAAIGNAKACRAVGRANGANPVCVVVPCHRVVGADGGLTGFTAGVGRKRWLLDHERAVADGRPLPVPSPATAGEG